MAYFNSVVHRNREDLTVLGGNAQVENRSRVAFKNASWFPVNHQHNQDQEVSISHLTLTFSNRGCLSRRTCVWLTQEHKGSTSVWVYPCHPSLASCVSYKGHMFSRLCRRWRPSGRRSPEVGESNLAGLSWPYHRWSLLWSPSSSALH